MFQTPGGNALMFEAGTEYRDGGWPIPDTPSGYGMSEASDASDTLEDELNGADSDSVGMDQATRLHMSPLGEDTHWGLSTAKAMEYANRGDGPRSIYERAREIMDSTTFLGHPDALVGVEVQRDEMGHIRYIRNGRELTLIGIGDTSNRAHGMAISAHGDKQPAYEEVDVLSSRCCLRTLILFGPGPGE